MLLLPSMKLRLFTNSNSFVHFWCKILKKVFRGGKILVLVFEIFSRRPMQVTCYTIKVTDITPLERDQQICKNMIGRRPWRCPPQIWLLSFLTILCQLRGRPREIYDRGSQVFSSYFCSKLIVLKFWGKQMPKTRYRYLALSDTYFSAWVPSLKLSQTCQGVKNFLQAKFKYCVISWSI